MTGCMAPPKKAGRLKKAAGRAKNKPDSSKTLKSLKTKVTRSTPILSLPTEIVLLVIELLGLPDQLALSRTNRVFHAIINPVIYKNNVRFSGASCIYWGAENGQLETLRHALAAGADLNAPGPLHRKRIDADGSTRNAGGNDDDNNIVIDDDHIGNVVNVVQVVDANVQIANSHDNADNDDLVEHPDFIPRTSVPIREPFTTPLHLAAKNGHRDIVAWLLDNGVDINAPSYHICECLPLKTTRHPARRPSEWPHWRALHTAMCFQEREVAELLLFRGASHTLDALDPSDTTGTNKAVHKHGALHSAASNALIPVLKLLAMGDHFDIDERDIWDNTALHYLAELYAERDSAEIRDTVAKLLALGADLEAFNEMGHTPLLYACFRGNYAVALRLLSVGANPDPHRHVPDFRDYRPLYFCTMPRVEFFDLDDAPVKHDEFEGNRVTLIKALIEAGADVDAPFDKRGHRGITALMLACELAEPRAVAALVQGGAKVNAQDRSGKSPLTYACSVRVDHRGEVPEIATILLRAGARLDLEEEPNSGPLDWAIKQLRWSEDETLDCMLKVATKDNLTQPKLREAMERTAQTGNHKALKALLAFADRVYGVSDADLKKCTDLVVGQSDPWNQRESFDCLMDFGRPAYSNETLLVRTILRKNQELSLAVLARGVSVSDVRLHGGQTYLHLACRWGDSEVVKALLERAADVNVFDDELRTPLSIAVAENQPAIACMLMREVADPHLVPSDELLCRLYEDEGERRYVKKRFLTAFDLAIRDDRYEILQEMVSRFELPDIPAGSTSNYIHRACQNPNSAILELILDNGADSNAGANLERLRPLHQVLSQLWERPRLPDLIPCFVRIAKLLISHKASFPDIMGEIVRYKGPDPDKQHIKEVLMRELHIYAKGPHIVCCNNSDWDDSELYER